MTPKFGFAPTRTRKRSVGQHLPSGKELSKAVDGWRRKQSLRSGSGYYITPPLGSRNVTPKQ